MLLEDLIRPVTEEEVEATMISVAQGLGLRVTNWNPLGVTRTLFKIMARTTSVYSEVLADIARAPFLGYARGPWLTLLASLNYGTDRYPDLFAVGVVTLTNSTPTMRAYGPGELVVQNTINQQTYRNTTAYSSAGNDAVGVTFSAEVAGAVGTSQPGTITQLVTSVPGISVSNPLALVGSDAETDSALTERARLSRTAISPNGPKGVHRYILTSPQYNPTSAPITRVTTRAYYATGHVVSFIATAAGAPSAGDIAISLASVIRHCEPMGVINEVYGANPVDVDVAATVHVSNETMTDVAVAAIIREAIAKYINAQPISGLIIPPATNGRLDASMLAAKVANALPSIVDVSVSTPTADTYVMDGSVLQPGNILVNVIRV